MRKHLFKLVAVLFVFAIGAAPHAYAADPALSTLKVRIPFDFIVGDKTLPSGSYTIASASGLDPRVIEIKNVYGHASVFTMSSSTQAQPETEVIATWRLGTPPDYVYASDELTQFMPAQSMAEIENFVVFKKYGDEYFISSIWMKGDVVGREFPQGHRLRLLAKSGASHDETVVFAARVR